MMPYLLFGKRVNQFSYRGKWQAYTELKKQVTTAIQALAEQEGNDFKPKILEGTEAEKVLQKIKVRTGLIDFGDDSGDDE